METTRRDLLLGGVSAAAFTTFGPGLKARPSEGTWPTEGAKTGQGTRRRVVRPPRLKPGDLIGLVEPAFATWDPVSVEIMEESLAALGFRTKRGRNLLKRRGYYAGTDEERAADLNAMIRDSEVKAIHCVRGGWGSARLLPLLDFDAMARTPKALIGYSDITALLLPFYARSGVITFHAPVGASKWNAFNAGWFKRVLMDAEAVVFENLKDKGEFLAQTEDRVSTITPGTARGRLLGGNLTVLTTIIGSGFLPDWDECILFLEDVEEAPYRIDRMFTQLGLAGILRKARAVIWGTCRDCDPGEGFGSLTIPDILVDHVKPLGVPAWSGAMIGHVDRQFTLPVGAEVEVDASTGTVRMLEPAVA